MPNKSGQPVRRDLDVLEHVRRYKLTTKAALRTQPFFQGAGKYAVDTVVDRLKSREHFSSHQLSNGQVYFQLGRAAANLLGVHERISRPLGDEPAIRAYTILSFCCLQGEQREQLTREELERAFPGSYERGARVTYYIDNEGTHDRLAYLRVDMGAVTRWDKLLTKLKQDIQKRCDNQTFRRLIDARRL